MAAPVARRDHRTIHERPHSHRDLLWGAPALRRPQRERRVHGPFRRRGEGRLLGGVAGAVSERTGLDVGVVRVGLVLAALASGFGIAAYVVAWLVVPADDEPDSIGIRALSDVRGLALAASLVPVLIVVLVAASALDAGWLGSWPLVVSAAGLVLVWRNGSETDRVLLRRAATPLARIGTGAGLFLRLAAGALLATAGVVALTLGPGRAVLPPVAGVGLVLVAVVLVFGPWWLSVGRELVVERQGRLRAEERVDLATRVHDSVLQTLAMIQRHADEPQRVAQLARAQERELRSWLFEGRPPGSFDDELSTVSAVVRRIQTDVEAAHGVLVEAVVVGDGPITDDLTVLLAAGREATVNAATWSGAPVVSLFAEVETGKVSLFVRDRGRGFDPGAVAPDRRGIAESIRGRMARGGGSAVVRSAPGAGTEVELTMPRGLADPARRATG